MDVSVSFLADLTAALAAATVLGFAATRLRLNPILGYLAAGIAIGRFTPGYVANTQTVETLAQLGLIFLLFSLGLNFSFGEIRQLGGRAIAGNLLIMALVAVAAGACARFLALPHPLTIALTTAVSSTAVSVALLRGWNVLGELPGRFTISQQVVQDLVAVALLVVTTAPASELSAAGVAWPVLKAVLFVVVALVLGATLLQRLVRRVIRTAPAEALFTAFATLALIAAWLGYLAGLSFEFGAFVAGAVISEASGSALISSVVAPFRALFVTLFFVSVGMLIDVRFLSLHLAAIVALGVGFALFRYALWWGLGRLSGLTAAGAALVGVGMTALGEFNVVLVTEAERARRLVASESQLLLAVTLTTIVVAVLAGPPLAALRPPWSGRRTLVEGEASGAPRVAIVGFGRVGATAAAVLRAAQVATVGLERDRETAYAARAGGHTVVIGDASDPVALERILLPSVDVVLVTVPNAELAAILTQRIAAEGSTQLIVRAHRDADVGRLRAYGAALALVPEAEGALTFAAAALRALEVDPIRVEAALEAQRHGDGSGST